MSYFFVIIVTFSILCATVSGATQTLAAALLDGAKSGVCVAITLAGPLCLWCGLNHLMEQSNLTKKLSGLLAPLLGRLFPCAWQEPAAREALCGNFSANLLGLGSAATPLGIRAAQHMARNGNGSASNELCKLIVLNTASIQLIPSTVAAVRVGAGCQTPFDILPAVWVTSVCSVCAGLLAAKVLSKWC